MVGQPSLLFGLEFVLFMSVAIGVLSAQRLTTCEDVIRQWNCSCIEDQRVNQSLHIDCSGKNLIAIPADLPVRTTHLDLSNNILSEVNKMPALPRLRMLNLAHSQIEMIQLDTFASVANLTTLYLQDNPINMRDLQAGVFDGLPSLTHIDISGFVAAKYLWSNDLSGLFGTSYRDDVFKSLTALESLIMDGLPYFSIVSNGTFGNGFSKLKKLRHLRIKGYFPEVRSNTFVAFSEIPISTLEIWSCWLRFLHPDAFVHFRHLDVLDLSYNPTLGFDAVANSWSGLSNIPIKQLILNRITAFDSNVQTLRESFFKGLEMTNITHLSLNGNHIIDMDPVFSRYVPQLEYLSIAYNRLEPLRGVDFWWPDLAKLTVLKHMDLSEQFRRLYSTEWELLIGAYPNPPMASAPGRRRRDVNIQTKTIVTRTRTRREAKTDGLPLAYQRPLNYSFPPSLEFIDMSESLSITLEQSPTINLYQAKNLKTFIYRRNDIQRFENLIQFVDEVPNNLTIDFSENDCTLVAIDKLFVDDHHKEALVSVILEKNNLGEYIQTRGEAIFSRFNNLQIVDLSENLIKDLPPRTFSDQPRLKLLDLSENSLRSFELKMSHMVEMQSLNLSYNLLPGLSPSAMRDLDAIASHRPTNDTLILDLNGNTFICDCAYVDFIEWVQLHRVQRDGLVVANIEQYMCLYDGYEQRWTSERLSSIVSSMKYRCNLTKYIIIGSVLLVVLVTIIGLSVCVYRHKWDIKFWMLNTTIKRKAMQQELVERVNITHDAFVAYHQDDVRWVKNELLQNTEENTEHSLKLILHHRDFLVGTIIEENIVQSIRCSRKTLLLISSKFLISNWCQFEIQMARAECFDIGRDIIIAVLLEPISVLMKAPGMSTIVQNILRKRTYVEWPENMDDREEFWLRLKEAVRQSTDMDGVCECGRVMNAKGKAQADRLNIQPA